MTREFEYKTRGTCSRAIHITLEDGIIRSVKFIGGCAGNTAGVSALVEGMPVEEAVRRLSGIRCGFKDTSCPDQLARALAGAINEICGCNTAGKDA